MAVKDSFVYFAKNSKYNLLNVYNRCWGNIGNMKFFSENCMQIAPLAVKKQNVSRAMKAYLERAKEHDEFMKIQHLDYQIGKRHLANMMGENPETFTQQDIDNAIEYLFPSGLFDRRAKPAMKKPEEVFPSRKAAEFDETGRPFHSMFYTGKPNFYKLLYDIVEEIRKLNDIGSIPTQNGAHSQHKTKKENAAYQWLSKDELELMLVEKIDDIEFINFKHSLDRLNFHHLSYKSAKFIDKYRKSIMNRSIQIDIPKPHIDGLGREYITTYECLRKTSRGDVTLYSPGTGVISINGKNITYFEDTQSREQVLFPLIFCQKLGKVDIVANVKGGGPSGQAGAIRWGISMCLRSFVDMEMVENMRLAGMLTRDYRRRERKKYGQEGARRKYTWKKR